MIILLEKPPTGRLFREQIIHITIKTGEINCCNKSFTDECANILGICTKLSYLNIHQPTKSICAKLSLWDRPRNLFCSSHLRTLITDVYNFEDCLCLLDDRLDQLSSFTVNIGSIQTPLMVPNNRVSILYIKYSLSAIFLKGIDF